MKKKWVLSLETDVQGIELLENRGQKTKHNGERNNLRERNIKSLFFSEQADHGGDQYW